LLTAWRALFPREQRENRRHGIVVTRKDTSAGCRNAAASRARSAKGPMTMAAKLVSLNLADNVLFAGGGAPICDGTSNMFLIQDGTSNTLQIRDGTSNIHLIQDGTSNTVVFSEFGQGGHTTDALAHPPALTAGGTQPAINFGSGHSLDLSPHPGDLYVHDFLFL
jgi:hypothetical protein